MSTDCQLDDSRFGTLSVAQQQRLTELLDAYLARLERGDTVDRAALIEAHPDLAGPLQACLEGLEFLQDAAAGFAPAQFAADEATFGVDPADTVGALGDGIPFDGPSSDVKRVGDFRILDEIGRGGMGVVYRAWQISLDRCVALKVLPFASLLDRTQIARFRNEAQAAARLHHPHIVPVFAVGNDRGVHYYAMQYIDGQPLDRIIDAARRAGRRPAGGAPSDSVPGGECLTGLGSTYGENPQQYFRTVAKLVVEAALALHAAHEEGIVHRDIKPSNLLLDAEGKLWVADFGLARCRTDSNLTGSGDLVGTMRYMSPEQARGSSAIVDHRTDVYSLGATLYELLTLRQAVRGADPAAIVRRLDQEDPYPPRQWDPNIPVDLETIVFKALAKSPEARYPTARALADDLRRFLHGEPIHARRPSVSDRIAKWIGRHRRSVACAALALILALVGLSVGAVLLTRQTQRTSRALVAAQDNYQQYRRQLARTTNHLGMLQERQGNRRAAAAAFQEAARLQREILDEQPADEETLRDLAATLNNLGVFHSATRPQCATHAYDESLSVLRRLVALTPEDDCVQAELALALSNLGSHVRRQGNPDRAVALLTEACRILTQLAPAEPAAADAHYDLAVCCNNLAMAESDLQRLDDAAESFLAALQAAGTAAAEAGKLEASQLSAVGGIYFNLGLIRAKQERLRDAATSFSHAIDLQQRAHRQAPQVARFIQLLDRHYLQGAAVMQQIGDVRQAAEWIAARQSLRPHDARHLWSVAKQWTQLARTVHELGAGGAEPHREARLHESHAIAALRAAIEAGLTPTPTMLKSDLNGLAEATHGADDLRDWFSTAGTRS